MKIGKVHWIGILVAVALIFSDFVFFREDKVFYLLLVISVIIGSIRFVLSAIGENEKKKEMEEMFLEFTRNLYENVRAGTPISKSIINVRGKDYRSLTPYIEKLTNQISLGIPAQQALEVFAESTRNNSIIRAVQIIKEAENAGGNIGDILEAVANSSSQIEKLKKERRAAVYDMVIQGYIIFVIFIIIMLIMQFKIIPMTANIGSFDQLGAKATPVNPEDLATPMLVLLVVQGLFTGLVVGKLAEGNVKAGIKHSFILMIIATLVSSSIKAFFSI